MEETRRQSEEDGANNGPGFKNSLLRVKEKCLPGIKGTLIISIIANLAMLVIGSINVHNCPVNKSIPLFLIIIGAVGLSSKFFTYNKENIDKYFQTKYLLSALYCVETIFMCLGIFWVYSIFKPDFNSSNKNYCDKTTYMLAFIYITVILTVSIAIIIGFICFGICSYCLAKHAEKSYDPEAQNVTRNIQGSATYLTNEEG